VIDLFLHRGAFERLECLLETQGLAHFLQPGGGLPISLDEERLRALVDATIEELGRVPVPSAVEACYRAIRRCLIAHLAEAMVHVGY
jgi:hypothetical protein